MDGLVVGTGVGSLEGDELGVELGCAVVGTADGVKVSMLNV